MLDDLSWKAVWQVIDGRRLLCVTTMLFRVPILLYTNEYVGLGVKGMLVLA